MPLHALMSYLRRQPPGPLADKDQIEQLLISAWDELPGSADGGMESYKLKGRMENVAWNSPILSFRIERHGGTVNGSVYAEMQQWEVDCEKGFANYDKFNSRRRQVAAKSRPLKVVPIAKEIANVVLRGAEDDRLKWLSSTEVKVLISEVISGAGAQQTVSGRRKRFYAALENELAETGWAKRANSPVFELSPPPPKATRPKKAVAVAAPAAVKPAKKRKLSPEGRKRIVEAMKRRWAAKKKADAVVAPVAAKPAKMKKRNISPEWRKRIAEAVKKRWAAQKAAAK